MKLARINVGLLALGAMVLVAGPAAAAVNPNSPKVLLHVKATTVKNQCSIAALADNCANANTKGATSATTFFHVQLITERGDSIQSDAGVAGVQIGLDYMGGADANGGFTPISIFGWSLCATLEFASPSPAWPQPGSGNLITWDAVGSCQRNRLAIAGYFYLGAYEAGTLRLTRRPADNVAKVADCGSIEVIVPDGALGFAAFSAGAVTEGCNPCLTDCAPVAVEQTTWSKVKNLLH
jgi:hypothetical protein